MGRALLNHRTHVSRNAQKDVFRAGPESSGFRKVRKRVRDPRSGDSVDLP
jgi:hypothetical protein